MNKEKVVWTKQKAAKSGVLFGLHFVFLVLIAFVLLLGDKLSSLAIEMRCFCPPESFTPRSPISVS